MRKRIIDLLLFFFLFISFSAFITLILPLHREHEQTVISAIPVDPNSLHPKALGFEQVEINADMPDTVRLGGNSEAVVVIKPIDWITEPGKDFTRVVMEARLEIPGTATEPNGIVGQPLISSKGIRFAWNVKTVQPGIHNGTLWIYIRTVDSAEQWPILAKPVQITTKKLSEAQSSTLRWFSALGSLAFGGMIHRRQRCAIEK